MKLNTQRSLTQRALPPVKLLKRNRRTRPSIPQWMAPAQHAAVAAAPTKQTFVALFKGV